MDIGGCSRDFRPEELQCLSCSSPVPRMVLDCWRRDCSSIGAHEVTLHARSAGGADAARRLVPEAKAVAIGDLSSIEETQRVAEQVNSLGRHDAVIHNA